MIAVLAALSLTCLPIAVDGDTIRCGNERIRLIGIDAPEIGPCKPRGRVCVTGDAVLSKQSLTAALRLGTLKIERRGLDRYGRTLAFVTAGGHDLSCYQVRQAQAVYVKKWDVSGRVAKCVNQNKGAIIRP